MRELRGQQLQRDRAAEPGVFGAPDHPHTPSADLFDETVGTEEGYRNTLCHEIVLASTEIRNYRFACEYNLMQGPEISLYGKLNPLSMNGVRILPVLALAALPLLAGCAARTP